jgi:Transposase DDE domain group 1
LLPEIERQQKHGKEVVVRADAAFAKPEIYEALEERDVNYAIRIPANENLERNIAELLPRPVGRPSIRPLVEYKSFLYQTASWKKARRVVAKVEHHQGELFPRLGFISCPRIAPKRAQVSVGSIPEGAAWYFSWVLVRLPAMRCQQFGRDRGNLPYTV